MTPTDKDFQPEMNVDVNVDTIIGSKYAQLVGISVSDVDITLEFVFVKPNALPNGNKQGQVVSRVTLPISAGLGLANVINETINKHITKRAKKV